MSTTIRLVRLFGLATDDRLHECRECGTAVEDRSTRCPTCDSESIASYDV